VALEGIAVALKEKRVTVSIGGDVMAAKHWNDETRLIALVGIGEHAGRLRIVAATNGRRLRAGKGVARHLDLPRWPRIQPQAESSTSCAFKLDADGEGAVEIQLPGWAQPQRLAARAA
jgi:hypothetical protein